MTDISPEFLKSVLDYEPGTGAFRWKTRNAGHFPNCVRPEHQAKIWNARFAGKAAFVQKNWRGVLRGTVRSRTLLAHRAAWAMHFGEWPLDGIDHVNGNPSDNRICNLRSVSHSENMKNTRLRSDNRSDRVGVYFSADRNRWCACITLNGKQVSLGRHLTKRAAIAARDKAEREAGFHQNHGRKFTVKEPEE